MVQEVVILYPISVYKFSLHQRFGSGDLLDMSTLKSAFFRAATALHFNGSFHMFQFKIALCQLYVTSDKDRNIAHARETIEEAARKGAQLILLPVRE